MPIQLTDAQRGPLGTRLHRRRKELGLGAVQVAAAADISEAAYNRWETGKTDNPRPRNLAKAAEKLETSVLYLLTGQVEREEEGFAELRRAMDLLREGLAAVETLVGDRVASLEAMTDEVEGVTQRLDALEGHAVPEPQREREAK